MQGEPPGGYWIRFADVDHICSEGDSWAFSGFDGFPAEGINWDDLLKRPTVSSVAPVETKVSGQGGSEIMSFETWILVAGLLLAALGLVLFWRSRGRASTIALAMIAVCGIQTAGYGQDFAGASVRGHSVSTIQTQAIDPMGNAFEAAVDPIGWHLASARQAVTPVESIEWDAAEHRTVQGSEVVSPAAAKKAQALVFFRQVGCSECTKEISHLLRNLVPLGWKVSASADADFRLVDVLVEPELARLHGVQVVPTTVYLSSGGGVHERYEGFSPTRSLTSPLNKLLR